jgi:MYXO-CTERM domain-containing protein
MTARLTALGLMAGTASIMAPGIGIQQAAADTIMVQQADPNDLARTRERNGVLQLRPTDEEHTNEQAVFAFQPDDPATGLAIMMGTGQLASGASIQVGNIQGACMPISLAKSDQGVGVTLVPDTASFKYISQRQSDDNRAFHNPEVVALGNGLYAVMANWDRDNRSNTERYMQVVDQQCNVLPLESNTTVRENGTSALIMAKNNDNCSGHQSGGGCDAVQNEDGSWTLMCGELCNGNGRDDGWANQVKVSVSNGVARINKVGDVSIIDREERSRPNCEQMGDGLTVCTGTEGNSQPQREGVWAIGVDNATMQVLWKEMVAHRGEDGQGRRTYAMRIKSIAERDISGAKTGTVYIQYQMHRGNNNGNDKGGRDEQVMLALAKPTRDGLNLVKNEDITSMITATQIGMTHATLFQSFGGTAADPTPTVSILAGSHNGNGDRPASVMSVLTAGDAISLAGATRLGAPYDTGRYSKYLGNNPNNQGRNYTECKVVTNPFAGEAGPAQGLPILNMCMLTGKYDEATRSNPAIKTDLVAEIWSPFQAPAVDPGEAGGTPGEGSGEGGGSGGGDQGTPETPNSSSGSIGGCSVGSGSTSGGAAILLLLGLALGIRRRL